MEITKAKTKNFNLRMAMLLVFQLLSIQYLSGQGFDGEVGRYSSASSLMAMKDEMIPRGVSVLSPNLNLVACHHDNEADSVSSAVSFLANREEISPFHAVLKEGTEAGSKQEWYNDHLAMKQALFEEHEGAISIYPNPVSDLFIVLDIRVNSAKIYNVDGKLVLSPKLRAKSMNVAELDSGTYLLMLLDREGHVLSTNQMIKK